MGEWTVVTDENGVAEFEVDFGNYTAIVDKAGYDEDFFDIPYRADHTEFTVNITKYPEFTMHVINEADQPLEDVYVKIKGSQGTYDGWTDSEGNAKFQAFLYGDYEYTLSKESYSIISKSFTFDADHAVITEVMVREEGHALTLEIIDEYNDHVEGFKLELTNRDSGMKYAGTTNEDGIMKFDIPHGTYTIESTFNLNPRFEPFTNTIYYQDSVTKTINVRHVFRFLITDKTTKEKLSDALIVMKNTDSGAERTIISDKDGEAWLTILAGKYHATISKNGYKTFEADYDYNGKGTYQSAALEQGEKIILRIIVKDDEDNPLPEATVRLYN